jgi:ketose-bisphosphate aldolase
MLIPMKELLAGSGGGIASFNCVDLEMARACVQAAEECGRPLILGLASRHWRELGGAVFVPSLLAICAETKVETVLHLDHAKPSEADIISEALEAGFTSVMIDGSKLSFEENSRVTAAVVGQAARYGASVEAELGPIIGEEGVAGKVDASASSAFTDPDEAVRFCAETGVDALAVAVGTAHGLYTHTPQINLKLIGELAATVPVPLVLHGATGIPDNVIQESVRLGIRKINFFSGLLVAAMDVLRDVPADDDNDYMALRSRLREAWRETARQIITLYAG